LSFAKYAALVKNLRGVVLADLGEEGVLSSVKWLVAKFKYRNLGLPPSLANEARKRGLLGKKPFRELATLEPVEEAARALELAGLSRQLAKALAYASAYVSPLVVVGSRFAGEIERAATDKVLKCKEVDAKSWKLHLRIADYVVLDFYEEAVDEALEALRGRAELGELLERRARRISKDKRRFWRVACESGELFVAYFDNLAIASRGGRLGLLSEDSAAALAIVAAVLVPAGMGQAL